jgi:hypothetical protein
MLPNDRLGLRSGKAQTERKISALPLDKQTFACSTGCTVKRKTKNAHTLAAARRFRVSPFHRALMTSSNLLA